MFYLFAVFTTRSAEKRDSEIMSKKYVLANEVICSQTCIFASDFCGFCFSMTVALRLLPGPAPIPRVKWPSEKS